MIEQHLIIRFLALSLNNSLLIIIFRDGEHLTIVVEIGDIAKQGGGVNAVEPVINLQGFIISVH